MKEEVRRGEEQESELAGEPGEDEHGGGEEEGGRVAPHWAGLHGQDCGAESPHHHS